jgi:hypothetical protein
MKTVAELWAEALPVEPAQTLWEWAEGEVEFRKPYASAYEGRFSTSYAPIWREPMEAFQSREVAEIWILAPKQSGKTENLLLMPMRWCVARRPCDMLYIGGGEKATEEFIRERIKPGLRLSPRLRERMRQATGDLEHAIYWPDMLLVCGWSANDDIFEMRPIDVAFCDEFDKWASYAPDKIRSRVRTRPFAKIVGVSSLYMAKTGRRHASRHPILTEIRQTDQRRVFVRDPGGPAGERMRFAMGFKDRKTNRESPHGLKWSEDARRPDGTWDMQAVQESAHYMTPRGARVDDSLRRELIAGHEWRPTAECRDPRVRGYIPTVFDLPFESLGSIATRFLKAVAKKSEDGNAEALRVFIASELCEEPSDEKQSIHDDAVQKRQADYAKGERPSQAEATKAFYIGRKATVLMTVDVQQVELIWLAREWIEGGDSGLIDWGVRLSWEEIDTLASKTRGYGASRVGVDSSYGERTQEVYEACMRYRMIPLSGKENIPDLLFAEKVINPFEGTRNQSRGSRLGIIYFKTDPFKSQLLRRVNGQAHVTWSVYRDIETEYAIQVTSEERRATGEWTFRDGHPRRNHLWDLEDMQLVLATRFGFNRFRGYELPAATAASTPHVEAHGTNSGGNGDPD